MYTTLAPRYGLDSTASTSDMAVTLPAEASLPGKKKQQQQGHKGKGKDKRGGQAAGSPEDVAVRIPKEAATMHQQVTVADAQALSALAIRCFKGAFAHVNTQENMDTYVSETLSVDAHAHQLADPLNSYFWAPLPSPSPSPSPSPCGDGDDVKDGDGDGGGGGEGRCREGGNGASKPAGRGAMVGYCKLRRPEGLLQGECPEPCVTGDKAIELGMYS
jgi:hypothetical protein